MNLQLSVLVLWLSWNIKTVISDATDYNTVNKDGSFAFGLKNSDYGGHYHTATGNKNNVVTGRYGSRNPSNRKIEETKYTAGPRGFRPQGPNVQRKFDQSQAPSRHIGTIHDPLADPYEDPSYHFGFQLINQQRQETANQLGQVNGLYSYLDDVGESHLVRYAAGAGSGFKVLNAVPDSPASVQYNLPLYKAIVPTARGKIAFESGPNGQYKFISSAPDQRRSETTGPDGITRGSYSYLDDKNVQRTVEYIAGAGIGYKILKSVEGAGTHILPRPVLSDYQIVPDDYSHYQTIQSPSPAPTFAPILPRPSPTAFVNFVPNRITASYQPIVAPTAFAVVNPVFSPTAVGPSMGYQNNNLEHNISREKPYKVPLTSGFAATGSGGTSGSGSYEHTSNEQHHDIPGLVPPYKFPSGTGSESSDSSGSQENNNSQSSQEPAEHRQPSQSNSQEHRDDQSSEYHHYNNPRPFRPSGADPNKYQPTKPALQYGDKIPHSNRNHLNGGDGGGPRVIGKWYPVPSHDVKIRARVQNIDYPAHRALSPSDALRRDEENEYHERRHHQQHQH